MPGRGGGVGILGDQLNWHFRENAIYLQTSTTGPVPVWRIDSSSCTTAAAAARLAL